LVKRDYLPIYQTELYCNIDAYFLSLNLENVENKECKIILNVITLGAENEIEFSVFLVLVRQNYIWGEGGLV